MVMSEIHLGRVVESRGFCVVFWVLYRFLRECDFVYISSKQICVGI